MNKWQVLRSRWLTLSCVVLILLVGYFGYQWFSAANNGGTESSDSLVGPYLNSVGTDKAKVIWLGPQENLQASVSVENEGRSKKLRPRIRPIPGASAFLYIAEIKGLRPDTQYNYLLHSQDQQIRGSFRTLPTSEKHAFTFALYGDSRTGPDHHRVVADAVADEKPLFVLFSGDFVTEGLDFSQWPSQFFKPAAKLLREVPLWPARGNHDKNGPLYQSFFELPDQELYYGFDCGSASFIILDSSLSDDEQLAQVKWLENHLAKLRNQRPDSWIFVMVHRPMFNIGGNHSNWGHDDVLPVLQKGKVDFVLSGHSHLYERILPIRSENGSVMQHIVSAGGGAPLYAAKGSPLLANGIGLSVHHYCLFTVGPERVSVVVKQPDGKVIDRFTVIKPEPDSPSQGNLVFEQVDDKPAVGVPAISLQKALSYQLSQRRTENTPVKNPR